MELTEPWKSMKLAIDGAIVEGSDATSVLIRFPAIPAEDFASVYAVLHQSLRDAGWVVRYEDSTAATRQADHATPGGAKGTLGVTINEERPVALISVMP